MATAKAPRDQSSRLAMAEVIWWAGDSPLTNSGITAIVKSGAVPELRGAARPDPRAVG